MKKQILKGITMITLVVGIAFVSAVVSANGQSRTKATVPFDFIVGSESMPAGQYTVRSSNAQGDVLRITSTDLTKDIVRLSNALYGQSDKPKLVFHRYGDRYFLAEIWDGDQGRMLVKSKQERAAQRELARTEKSSQTAKASFERVEVLAQVQ